MHVAIGQEVKVMKLLVFMPVLTEARMHEKQNSTREPVRAL